LSNGPQPLVLVVDPDPGAAAALGPALRRGGYQVRIARDGARALQLTMARVPDVVLLDEGTPVVAPRTLVRILRSNPRTSGVPVLFAGADAQRLPEGANAFVQKPADPGVVLGSIRTLLGEVEAAAAREEERVEGSLSQLPLPDVLQMLGNNCRSGRLVVSAERARAEIVFQDGVVVDATSNGAIGEKGFLRALSIREGRFVFQPGDAGPERRVERPLTELLLDGLLAVDELAALAEMLPARDALLERASGGEGAGELLEVVDPAADELRSLLDAPRRFDELMDAVPRSDLEIARTVLGMLAAGELRIGAPVEPASVTARTFLSQADAHSLRTRLGRGEGPAIGKVLVAGGDERSRRVAIERLGGFEEFRASPVPVSHFGTLGAFELADLRLDVVLLPSDPLLQPLGALLSAGALARLELEPGRSDEAYEPDPAEALRALVVRAAARAGAP
jgi:DNA-binding response OmpR family regulator